MLSLAQWLSRPRWSPPDLPGNALVIRAGSTFGNDGRYHARFHQESFRMRPESLVMLQRSASHAGSRRRHAYSSDQHRHRCQRAGSRRISATFSKFASSPKSPGPDVSARRHRTRRRVKTPPRLTRAHPRQQHRFGGGHWQVVGVFDAGGSSFDSEVWCDSPRSQRHTQTPGQYLSVGHRPSGSPATFQAFKDALTTDPRLTSMSLAKLTITPNNPQP